MYDKHLIYYSLKVFGCLVYANSYKYNKIKFEYRTRKYIFLGHKYGVKGDVLFNLKTKQLVISRDTIVYEHIFPNTSNTTTSQTLNSNHMNPNTLIDYSFDYLTNHTSHLLHQISTLPTLHLLKI